MSCNWKTLPLGEILELVIDHRGKTPKKLGFKDFQTEGYPVLSAKHVKTSGLVNLDSIRYANLEMYKKWMKVPVQEGDVVLTSEAPMGETFFIDGSIDYVLGQRLFGLRPKKELIEPRYLMAWLSSEVGQNKLKQRASGSTVQGIKQAELLKIEIDVPPLRTQKIIANNEAYISKKINLNKKLNQTLEQIAQAIFKSWFVDSRRQRRRRPIRRHASHIRQRQSTTNPAPNRQPGALQPTPHHRQTLSLRHARQRTR